MFNENFSFVSGTSDPISASADISPYTSRCSSPHLAEARFPRTFRDTRYDSYRPRHPSITALTAQLESQDLSEQRRPSYASLYQDEPSPADYPSFDQDEGYYEGPETPASTSSEYSSSEFDPSLYDLSMSSDLSVTSSPRPSLSLEAQSYSSHSVRRRQRQALIRLQCLAKCTPDLAMLIEECHPSSMPLPGDVSIRSGSTCSVTSGRVEKERRRSSAVRKSPKMRKERR